MVIQPIYMATKKKQQLQIITKSRYSKDEAFFPVEQKFEYINRIGALQRYQGLCDNHISYGNIRTTVFCVLVTQNFCIKDIEFQ